MTNLIPPEAKRSVKKEYWVRVCSVWAFLCSGVLLGFSALLLPTYVLFSSQIAAFSEESRTVGGAAPTESYTAALAEITRANTRAVRLSEQPEGHHASELLAAVEDVQSSAIELRGFSANSGANGQSINVRGVAEDRAALAAFANALKRSSLFTEAEVPVSSLVREENLPFDITVRVVANEQ